MAEITIYTDGGCTGNPGPGGWAFVFLKEGEQQRFSGGEEQTTNNRMELTAVIKALEFAKTRDIRQPIQICTDSQYVKKGLTQWIHNWVAKGWKTANGKPVKNRELWEELQTLSKGFNLEWVWVKGHSGNPYNELCDRLVAQERGKF